MDVHQLNAHEMMLIMFSDTCSTPLPEREGGAVGGRAEGGF